LRRRGGVALDSAERERQAQRSSHRARDFERLIEPALAQACPMERHREQRFLAGEGRAQRFGEQQTEGAAERAPAMVLEGLHVIVERRNVVERRHDGVDVPRRPPPRATRDGPREAAAAAGRNNAWPLGDADGTEAVARVLPTARANGWD
jgi:hypothetical protein